MTINLIESRFQHLNCIHQRKICWIWVVCNWFSEESKSVNLNDRISFRYLLRTITTRSGNNRLISDRRMEVLAERRPRHQRYRMAGRQPYAAPGSTRKIPSEDNVPRGAALYKSSAAGSGDRKMFHGPRRALSSRYRSRHYGVSICGNFSD